MTTNIEILSSATYLQSHLAFFYTVNYALVNGSQSENGNLYSGRLQIVNSDVPGLLETICSNTWTENLAQITCNIVGYANVVNAYAGQGGIFGAGQGEIFDRFECQQLDARFNSVRTTNCSVRSKNNTCDHSMDAGAECSGKCVHNIACMYVPMFSPEIISGMLNMAIRASPHTYTYIRTVQHKLFAASVLGIYYSIILVNMHFNHCSIKVIVQKACSTDML